KTSCLMLPAVLRWNRTVNEASQKEVAAAMGERDAADAVERLVADLGLPTRLSALGIGRAEFPEIARRALAVPAVRANPRPITSEADLLEILALAA
ncbi:MAG TPA: iron-containing alcohol dehydrogenase, partial [Stellaceae bacterium]|nr:iron-containing alcohol dehydrogenase [Stellaceae bacterium]